MLPPGLSMLWESVDPADALTERFGFVDLGAAQDWVVNALRSSWEITARSCTRLVISDNNVIAWVETDRGPLVMKWSRAQDRFEALEASTRLLHALGEHGAPVAAPLPARDGRVRVVLNGPAGPLSAAALPELTGDWLDVDDLDAVHSAGTALATIHQALAASPVKSAQPPAPPPDLDKRITGWLARSDRGCAPEISRRLQRLLADAPPLDAPPQLVHHDVRAANILTRDSAVVGVLDFDEVGVSYRVDDLARASVYLATRFTNWGPTPRPARQALREGYEAEQPLSDIEAHWLEILTLWYGLSAIPGGEDLQGWAAAV